MAAKTTIATRAISVILSILGSSSVYRYPYLIQELPVKFFPEQVYLQEPKLTFQLQLFRDFLF
jgi:hypothetical protein